MSGEGMKRGPIVEGFANHLKETVLYLKGSGEPLWVLKHIAFIEGSLWEQYG